MSAQLSAKLDWELANPIWAQALNTLLAAPLSSMSLLKDVHLINGITTFPHKLGRLQRGWIIVDINGAAQIYRNAPLNASSLTLTSNAAVIATIGVF